MIETTIVLKDPSEWRPGLTKEDLIAELDQAIQIPGLTNAWTMPIKTRIDMLSTGIKTPVGIKVAGPDLTTLEQIAEQVEAVVKPLPGTLSVYAERVMGGSYIDFEIDREAAARFGIKVGDIQDVIQSAVGGMNVSWTVEVSRDIRSMSVTHGSCGIPRRREGSARRITFRSASSPGPVGRARDSTGPPGIKTEGARPNAWVYVDLRGIDVGHWVEKARQEVAEPVDLPAGYSIFWSGQYEYMQRAKACLLLIVPITLLVIFLILYFHTRSLIKTAIVLSAIPFALVGSIWLMDWLGYNWSVAVWVGVIALAGLAAETGVVMLLYLDIAYEDWQKRGRMRSFADLREAVDHGAVQRIRPKTMAVVTTFIALVDPVVLARAPTSCGGSRHRWLRRPVHVFRR